MKTSDMLLIGGLVVGGYVLMTSGILTPKSTYVPPTTGGGGGGGGGGGEMHNVDTAGKDFESWLGRSQLPVAQGGLGRLPTGQERVAWWRERVGFEASAAWAMEDWYNAYYGTYGVLPTRTMVADEVRAIGAEHGYSERT